MAGVYIHIPFCKQKCTYCDFHFSTTFYSYQEKMIDAMLQEIRKRSTYLEDQLVETIYFGGGTPSLLTHAELDAMIQEVNANFTISPTVEITLEANPDDITVENLSDWKNLGINRLSIGLQSFRNEDLKWMNRAHNQDEALKCVALAQKMGFDNINVDLIYGLPNLSLEDWQKNIQTVINLGIQHVSAYCLTVEKKTVLSKWVEQRKIIPSGEDEQSDQFELLINELEKAGIEQYEISNFAIPGKHSIHNSNYWKGKHYLGIGPSAHSFNGTSRSWNIANNQRYIQYINAGNPHYETEQLQIKDRFNELLLIGLRTVYGVDIEQLKTIQEPSPLFWKKLENMTQAGWVVLSEKTISLTKEGKLKADYIASELFV